MGRNKMRAGERRSIAKYRQEFGGTLGLSITGFLFGQRVLMPLLAFAAVIFGGTMFAHAVGGHVATGAGIALAFATPVIVPNESKALETKLDALDKDLKAWITKAEAEIKTAGSMSVETKNAVEAIAAKAVETASRLLAIEQKLTAPRGDDPKLVKSVGEMFTDSDQYKAMVASGASSCQPMTVKGLLHKTALVNATGQLQPLVAPFRMPGITTPADQPLTIRDVVPSIPIGSNILQWVKESSYTPAAAPQGAGTSPQVFENVSKAEAAITFSLQSTPVQTIAHWIPISNQLLSDAPALQAYINVRLLYGLKKKEEDEFVNGDGTGANLSGLLASGNFTAYDTTDDVVGDNRMDTLRHAIKQARVNSFYVADALLVHPSDWELIELTKQTGTGISSGEYLIGNPAGVLVPRLWGKPVVECDSLTPGTFVVGAFQRSTMILDREGASVSVSREHASFFIQNMTAVLCEERVGFVVTRPAAIISGTFGQGDSGVIEA